MTNRIIEIGERVASLRMANRLLEITTAEGEKITVPPTDIAVLLLANPRIRLSQAVLSTLAGAGGMVVVVGDRFLPSALLLPLDGNALHSEVLRLQAAAPLPLKKRLWKQVVREKIRNQATLLDDLLGDDAGLGGLADRVRSGDPENMEGRAARIYWKRLFGPDFLRDRDADDHNMLLNYGYTVLRAAVARAVCSAGLHPAFGLHHHSRYDPFCLADDLIEPFRPLVDRVVSGLLRENGFDGELTPAIKRKLLEPLTGDVRTERGNEKWFALLSRTAASLVRCLRKEDDALVFPKKLLPA